MRALTTLRLCERFHCLPSQLAAEDADLLRMLDIESMVREVREGGEYGE